MVENILFLTMNMKKNVKRLAKSLFIFCKVIKVVFVKQINKSPKKAKLVKFRKEKF